MDIQEAIFTRRSIRKFTGETVDDKTLELVIRAGRQEPSANNKHPWHFVIVKDEKLLKNISDGHPTVTTSAVDRYNAERVHRETW